MEHNPMIAALRRRPTFEPADLLLSQSTGELHFMPDEMAPHTVNADLIGGNRFVFSFEYSFDEIPIKQPLNHDILLTLGKYSQKVMAIEFQSETVGDLDRNLVMVQQLLRLRQISLPKASYKKNYDLVCELLEQVIIDIRNNPSVVPFPK
jgi:hypothetical protein